MERPSTYGLVAPVGELVRQRPHTTSTVLLPSSRVRTLRAGIYDSAFLGRGMEFDESRAYQPGDDVRAIDWRVTARTGRTHTKLYHEERERPVLLVVDARPMMRFGTRDAFKSVQAARTAATIAWAARDGGDRVGGLVLAPSGHRELPPSQSQGRLLALLRAISAATEDAATTPGPTLVAALSRLERVARPGMSIFIVSDFFDLEAGGEKLLSRLARRCDVTCVLVYDALETTPPADTGYRISDGERVLALAGYDGSWRRAYAERFAARRTRLETLCRTPRLTLVTLATGDDPVTVLRAPPPAHEDGGGSMNPATTLPAATPPAVTSPAVTPMDPLAHLRGLHLPDPVDFWPPAPGWWALAGFLVAAAIVTVVLARRRRRSLGHHALRELGRVSAADGDVQDTATALSELMRRVAIQRWGADEVAALHGREWQNFLASNGPPAPTRSRGPGRRRALDADAARLLAIAPYAPPRTIELRCEDVTIERAKLLHAVRRWIKRNA